MALNTAYYLLFVYFVCVCGGGGGRVWGGGEGVRVLPTSWLTDWEEGKEGKTFY